MASRTATRHVEIPHSQFTVSVSIVDTTTSLWNIESSLLIKPAYSFTSPYWSGPSYSFLIRHPNGNLLFDLGTRKDWETSLPPSCKYIKELGWKVHVDKDVPELLTANGVKLTDINAIAWSHHHWDHVGDPSLFPPSTDLVVGPGFKGEYLPAYPSDPNGKILDSDHAGRQVLELDFDKDNRACQVGGFRALNWFRDGSFYFIDAPGHTVGHICALARTTPSESGIDGSFLFMGGDIAHHCGEHRPSSCHLLPESFSVAQADPPLSRSSAFYQCGSAHNMEDAAQSLQKLMDLEADERVWVVSAHDGSLLEEGVEFFPKEANDWKTKGWREKTFWKFLEKT